MRFTALATLVATAKRRSRMFIAQALANERAATWDAAIGEAKLQASRIGAAGNCYDNSREVNNVVEFMILALQDAKAASLVDTNGAHNE